MQSGRVLLLEDDAALCALLVEALSIEGFTVRACGDIGQLRQAASQHEGDIVVADFWGHSQRALPDLERDEIRELSAILPVVLLTGRAWAADTSPGELGARAIIRKPFDLEILLDAVGQAMADSQV